MKWFHLVLIVLNLMLSLASRAQEATESDNLWSKHFAGRPHPGLLNRVDDKNSEWPIRQWIKGYEQCRGPIDSLWTDLETYQELFFSGRYQEAEEIHNKLKNQQSTSGDCSQPLWTALMVKSVLLGPMAQDQRLSMQSEGESEPGLTLSFLERNRVNPSVVNRDGNRENRSLPPRRFTDYRYELSLLVAFLGNRGTLQKLSPHLRHVFAGDYPDSLWLQKNDEGYFTVAFYDCFDSLIYLDTELRPFNLAASIYHELDHLYRDKKIGSLWSNNSTFSAPSDDDEDIQKYIALDELLATISSGFYQRRMLEVDRSLRLDGQSLGNEFNFFQVDGPLNESFDLLFSDSQQPLYSVPNPSDFLANLSNYGSVHGGHRGEAILCEMQKIILNGYFDETEGQNCESAQDLLGDFREMGSNVLDYEFRDFANFRAVVDRDYIPWAEGSDQDVSIKSVLEYFNGWAAALDKTSYNCKKIIESQNEGKIQGYLGTQLAGSLGGRTGNGGIRPWLMPMSTNSSEAERTVRPSNHGIRPCLRRKF